MSIGLHSKDIASKFSPLQQEIRKRTWFGCILLDRSLSMTFGRPFAIPEEYIRLDIPTSLPPSVSVPENVQQLSLAFYNASILLYRIMGRIIVTLYGSNLGCDDQTSETTTMTSIIQLGQELADWQVSLPTQLGLYSVCDLPHDTEIQNPTVERFRVVLTLRYLNVQLLLHRPTFIRSLGVLLKEPKLPHRNAGSVNNMQASFDKAFVQVAENIIDIIYAVLMRPDHGRHLIGAWWFTLYYAFSAALAVFGSLLTSQESQGEVDGSDRIDRAKRSLNQVSEALGRLGDHNTIVSRCVKFLQQLLRLVNAWDTRPSQALDSSDPYAETQSITTADVGHFDAESNLLSTMPTWDVSEAGFGDELELGHFFASDFQRWFDRIRW
ncbi:hypothetical protein FSARC_6655 [Fusarium sarcochroum]|uniref:Xylanolytic transcriptional activator regulatory domain-containing protein n=1 Tax=Fusarium sarcochroum TaxID=1208366 RepID=A0A8H4X8S8_9HYPO|nr:hypothetical protein FSARC_6655 [Fusarium sarcochroum]